MQVKNIRIGNYVNYSSGNYGVHAQYVAVGSLVLYFSYDTVVAFEDKGVLTIRKNDWSSTTGKHLNAINDDKSIRIPGGVFEEKLQKTLEKYNLV